MSGVKILVGGDICPVNRYQDLFSRDDADAILGPFGALVRESDLFIANLECPIIKDPDPILKTGPVLGISSDCAKGLRSMGLHALGLANNHIMDHGASGLASTMSACAGEGISIFGAGTTLEEARRIRILETKGRRVGLCAMAEHEWSLASSRSPGANPFDLIGFVRQMRGIRDSVDYLIVLLHAGSEGYELPSPGLRDACRFLIEEGANIVTCQHSHCVGSYEHHEHGLIVYGQGNFIFDYPSHGRKGRTGLLVSVELNDDGTKSETLVPFVQHSERAGLIELTADERTEFMGALQKRSEGLVDAEFIQAAWERFCDDRKYDLFNEVLGYGRLFRRLNRGGRMIRLRGDAYLRNLLSVVQNESASDVLQTSIRNMLKGSRN